MSGKRRKRASAPFIKLAEELDELQTVRMDIRAEQVDADVQRMSYQKYQDKHDRAKNAAAAHAAHFVKDGRNNAGRQTKREQTGIGQDIAEVAGDVVDAVKALEQTLDRVAGFAPGRQDNAHGPDARTDGRDRGDNGRQRKGKAEHFCNHAHGQQIKDTAADEQIPEHNVIDRILDLALPGELIKFDSKPGKQMDDADQEGKDEQTHRLADRFEPQRG